MRKAHVAAERENLPLEPEGQVLMPPPYRTTNDHVRVDLMTALRTAVARTSGVAPVHGAQVMWQNNQQMFCLRSMRA